MKIVNMYSSMNGIERRSMLSGDGSGVSTAVTISITRKTFLTFPVG